MGTIAVVCVDTRYGPALAGMAGGPGLRVAWDGRSQRFPAGPFRKVQRRDRRENFVVQAERRFNHCRKALNRSGSTYQRGRRAKDYRHVVRRRPVGDGLDCAAPIRFRAAALHIDQDGRRGPRPGHGSSL